MIDLDLTLEFDEFEFETRYGPALFTGIMHFDLEGDVFMVEIKPLYLKIRPVNILREDGYDARTFCEAMQSSFVRLIAEIVSEWQTNREAVRADSINDWLKHDRSPSA